MKKRRQSDARWHARWLQSRVMVIAMILCGAAFFLAARTIDGVPVYAGGIGAFGNIASAALIILGGKNIHDAHLRGPRFSGGRGHTGAAEPVDTDTPEAS